MYGEKKDNEETWSSGKIQESIPKFAQKPKGITHLKDFCLKCLLIIEDTNINIQPYRLLAKKTGIK